MNESTLLKSRTELKRILSILLMTFLVGSSYAQPNSFVKYFGSSQLISYGHGIHQSTSGSIYMAGYGDDISAIYSLFSFTKFDENGNEIFTKYYGDSIHHFMLMRMFVIDDNSFLLVGSKMVHGGNNNPCVLNVDSTGTIIFERSTLSSQNSWFTGVNRFSNGNLVFSGATTDTINGDLNLSGIITDPFGNTLHTFSFGDAGVNETAENCVVSSNGTVLVCGDKPASGSAYNPYVVAFDSLGNYLWDLTIASHLNSGSKNLYIDRNNDLIVIGESATDSSAQFDIQLTKVEIATGSQIWMKLIRGTNMSDAGFAISETIDGNYALTGYGHDSVQVAKRIVLIVTDTSGTELSKQYFGNSSINIGYDICPSIYGGFLIAGADFVNNQEVLVYQKELGIGIPELSNFSTTIYPNPILNDQELRSTEPFDKITICDATGRIICEEIFEFAIGIYSFPHLKNGLYHVKLESNGKQFHSGLIITE